MLKRLHDFLKMFKPMKEVSKIRFFKERGAKPLSEIDFELNEVIEMNMDSFQNNEKASHLYEELSKIPFSFELYAVPTVMNLQKEFEEMRDMESEELRGILSSLSGLIPDKDYHLTRIFLIVKRDESERLLERFSEIPFEVRGHITREEAMAITVQ